MSKPARAPSLQGVGDGALLQTQRLIAETHRRLDTLAAVVAGEIAHRSRRELGHDGLAARHGQRSAESLISSLTGSSTRAARTLVKTAELLPTSSRRDDAEPVPAWLAVLGDAVASARVSAETAEIIRTRLAAATTPASPAAAAVFEHAREAATTRLVTDAASLSLEQLAIRAAHARDELDLAGVPAREEQMREQRYLRVTRERGGHQCDEHPGNDVQPPMRGLASTTACKESPAPQILSRTFGCDSKNRSRI